MCSLVRARFRCTPVSFGLQRLALARQFFVAISHSNRRRSDTALTCDRLEVAKEMLDQYQRAGSNGLPHKTEIIDSAFRNVNQHDVSKKVEREYELAINALNSLQSNAASLRQAITANCTDNVQDTVACLERSGLTLDDLDQLSVIHVSGTKGKGSTCAITESILRCHGVRTGFFSSPHLVSVTERIRLNGQPVAKDTFVRHFWRVFNRLKQSSSETAPMPGYFKFLSILSFHIFLEEHVDVVLLEVGIGGELDCTNIVRKTKTVGITSLGLEHTQLLGDTLEAIAWQKSGIIKPHSHVFTYVDQPECLAVLQSRSNEKQASLEIVPQLKEYRVEPQIAENLNQLNDVIQLNGSLAIQLSYDWLSRHREFQSGAIATNEISEKVLKGLMSCHWPGRCEVIKLKGMNIHLDGAHTVESMRVCRDWFQRVTASANNNNSSIPKVLIFNTTGDRDAKKLMEILLEGPPYAMACFVPNISSGSANKSDMQTVYSIRDQLLRSRQHADAWRSFDAHSPHREFGSIKDALCWVHEQFITGSSGSTCVDVLVTGSIHLIGATVMALSELEQRADPTCIGWGVLAEGYNLLF